MEREVPGSQKFMPAYERTIPLVLQGWVNGRGKLESACPGRLPRVDSVFLAMSVRSFCRKGRF